jgi:hypothetical protein
MAPKILKVPLTAKILHLSKDGEVTDLTPKSEKPTVRLRLVCLWHSICEIITMTQS